MLNIDEYSDTNAEIWNQTRTTDIYEYTMERFFDMDNWIRDVLIELHQQLELAASQTSVSRLIKA